MKNNAQSSIEYLLLLAAFFAILGLVLPVISDTTQGFLFAEDDLLAKRIFQEVGEEVNLMRFLGDGSVKTFEFAPIKSIFVYSQGNELIVETKNKQYKIDSLSPQFLLKQELIQKFFLTVKKNNGAIQILLTQNT